MGAEWCRPHWVSKEVVEVAGENIEEAAQVLRKQLEADPGGLERVGGGDWWQIRGTALTGEWIEVRFSGLRFSKTQVVGADSGVGS